MAGPPSSQSELSQWAYLIKYILLTSWHENSTFGEDCWLDTTIGDVLSIENF